MCGIVSYVGPKSIDSVLLVGLTRLEYRGYDSAGVAVIQNAEINVRKCKGKIKDLEQLLFQQPIEGNVGIGHTRWATHGEPNRNNAHPHTDSHGRIAVVHNGIIENHYELRTGLQKKGHIFHSETDTEVIPHLIEENLKTDSKIISVLPKCIATLQGRYAFTMIYEGERDKIFFARNGSPLIFGLGRNECFLSSDLSAIIPLAKRYYTIENGQWGWISLNGEFKVFDKENRPVNYELKKIELKVSDIDKNGYKHFMLKEIFEQPMIMKRILDERMNDTSEMIHFKEKNENIEDLKRVTKFVIISAGTSWHAALTGRMYLEALGKVVTEVDMSSEFRYRNPLADGDTKVIAISQSGETADTLASVYEAKAKFLRVISFVNNTSSTIARESDSFIGMLAGPEIGVASTKAYTAQLVHLLLYSIHFARIRGSTPETMLQELCNEIRKLPMYLETILEQAKQIADWAPALKDSKDFVFLGRSWNYPSALEGALKLKETSYIHASGYAGGEFKHGPIALISENMPVVCLVNKSETYEKMLSNLEEVKARKAKIISIYTEGDELVPKISDFSFPIPPCSPFLTPILIALPLQLLSYYIAVERGCEPDQPRNLAKSVTVE